MSQKPTLRVIDGDESPVLDIQIGRSPQWRIRIFGFSDIDPPLVEVRAPGIFGECLNLTAEQADTIGTALIKAAAKARGAA